jgi:hypothetical protein
MRRRLSKRDERVRAAVGSAVFLVLAPGVVAGLPACGRGGALGAGARNKGLRSSSPRAEPDRVPGSANQDSQAFTLSWFSSTHFFAASSGSTLSPAIALATASWSSFVSFIFFSTS